MTHPLVASRPRDKARALGVAVALGAGLAPAVAHAQDPSFSYPSFASPITVSLKLASSEWVWDANSPPPPSARYSPNLDQRVRLFGSPWARSATLSFAPGGALSSGDSQDAIDLGWFGAAPSVTESGWTMPLNSMGVPMSGNNSLMNPGLELRFRTGAAPGAVGTESEAAGFAVSTFTVSSIGQIGSVNVPMLSPYQRGAFVLNANDSISDFVLPVRQSNERSTLAVWLNDPASAYASKVGVWARCNAFPDSASWDQRAYFTSNTPVLFELPACQGSWFITIGSTAPVPMVAHATTGAHYTNRVIPFLRVGIKFNATATERSGIARGFRSAAWRAYGLSMGTTLIKELWFYNNSSCNKIDGCGTGCNICVTPEVCNTNVSGFDGYMTICNGETSVLRTNNVASIETTWGPAQVIAHELGHQWLAQPDEYWDDTPCGDQGLCGHTMMELYSDNRHGLCTNANHRMHVEDRRGATWGRIAGPVGYACNGAAGWVDGASGWARMAGIVPGGVIPAFGAQNLNYAGQGFVALNTLGNAQWF